jgi:D-alanyl-D-alanine carboxypeptidase
MIVEAVTNSTVEEQMQMYFFTPLGMTGTSVSRNGAMRPPYAHGYSWLPTTEGIEDTSDWNLSWDWTAGSAVTTAEDILTWIHALFNGQLVRAETLEMMSTPVAPSTFYGYGIIISDAPEAFSHDGSNPGTATQWVYLPASKITIFIALNRLDTWLSDEEPVEQVVDAEDVREEILLGLLDILE